MTRQRVNRAALLTGARSQAEASTTNPLLPTESTDPFTARPVNPNMVTGTDAERLSILEDAIERAASAAGESLRAAKSRFTIEAGTALHAIQAGALYVSAGCGTFEAYAKTRWNMSRSRAYQLIEAAPIMMAMSKILDTAPVESQAIAMAPVLRAHGEDAVRHVWSAADQSGKVTAASIKTATRSLGYVPTPAAVPEQEQKQDAPADSPEADPTDALMDAVTALKVARKALRGAMATGVPEQGRALVDEVASLASGIERMARKVIRGRP